MQWFSMLSLLCFALRLNWAFSSSDSVYNMKCNHSSECTVYPNITQGPDWIWIPYFCNENNLCGCPNGWIPFLNKEICIAKVLGSIEDPNCTVHVWAISFLVMCLIAVMIYSCKALFSGPPRSFQTMQNGQNLPPAQISRIKV